MSEEIVGPVAPLTGFSSEEEVIAMSNDTTFGLGVYFYTRDTGECADWPKPWSAELSALNEGQISTQVAPFGNAKQSGIGREGSK